MKYLENTVGGAAKTLSPAACRLFPYYEKRDGLPFSFRENDSPACSGRTGPDSIGYDQNMAFSISIPSMETSK